MEKIRNAMQTLSEKELCEFNKLMLTLSNDMKNVNMESNLMAHEAEAAASCAFLNC